MAAQAVGGVEGPALWPASKGTFIAIATMFWLQPSCTVGQLISANICASKLQLTGPVQKYRKKLDLSPVEDTSFETGWVKSRNYETLDTCLKETFNLSVIFFWFKLGLKVFLLHFCS